MQVLNDQDVARFDQSSKPVFVSAGKIFTDDDIAKIDSQPKQNSAAGPLAQFGKGIYETAHQIPIVRQVMDMEPELAEKYGQVPEPDGAGQKIARMAGEGTALIPAFEGGAALAGEKLIGGALGIGAQQTAGSIQEGKGPIQSGIEGAAAAAGTYVGGKALDATGKFIGDMAKPVGEKISDTISDLYNKAVKPTVVKGNANMLVKSNANVETGIRSIINNKDNLSLGDEGAKSPESLSHASEAIEQTKNDIFNKYNAMQKQATGRGATLNGLGLAQTLQPIIDDKALEVVSPQTKEYAVKLFDRLQNAGEMTPEEAQDMIKGFNGRLKAYYRNPSPDQYGNTAVDALVANNARKILDEKISQESGSGYQDLKNQYGALSSMEKDVSRAAQRSSNYQNKGLLDFSDIFTGEQVARGILTGNPAEIASGIGGRLIKEYYKKLNNPDANIKNMFTKVSDLMQQEGHPAFSEKLSTAKQAIKEKLGGLADSIPSRQFSVAGQVGKNSNFKNNIYPFASPLEGSEAGQAGEAFAQPMVHKEPAQENPLEIGGQANAAENEGAPAPRYVNGKEGSINIQTLRENASKIPSQNMIDSYVKEHPQLAEKWKNFGKGSGALALAGSLVAGGNAQASLLPKNETMVIEKIAKSYNLSPEETNLLKVIRKVENGGAGKEFGALTPKAMRFKDNPSKSFETQAKWAAGTIKNKYKGNIDRFAQQWAPKGVANDPNNLNKNWAKNAKFYMKEFSKGEKK